MGHEGKIRNRHKKSEVRRGTTELKKWGFSENSKSELNILGFERGNSELKSLGV